jgi:putative sterol carrier protein
MSFKSEPLLDQIKETLAGNKSLKDQLIKKTNSKIVFNLKNKQGETKAWLLDLKDTGDVKVASEKDLGDADLTISVADLNFKKLLLGQRNSQQLFIGGKLKVKGDVMKAANIESVLKLVRPDKSKL